MLAGFLGEKSVLDNADVEAIAEEIQGELGMDGSGSMAATAAPAQPAAMDGTAAGAAPVPDLAIRRLEQRVERIERTVGATIDLLHSVLHPEKTGRAGEL